MEAWEKLFDKLSLENGRKIYQDKLVEIVKKTDTIVKAVTYGKSKQEVSVMMRNGQPVSLSCNCPKARGGRHCEHMAAAFFSLYGDSKALREKEQAFLAAKQKAEEEETKLMKMREAEIEKKKQEQLAKEETARRIAERKAMKAAKKVERKKKREEAEKAERLRRMEEEKKIQEENLRKEKAEIRKQSDTPSAYKYYDVNHLMDELQIPPEKIKKGMRMVQAGEISVRSFDTGYRDDKEELMVDMVGDCSFGKRGIFPARVIFSRQKVIRTECSCVESFQTT